MKNNNRFHVKNKQSIKAIESTDERITGRAGLALFSRYLRSNQLMTIVELKFGSMRKNKKGIPVTDLFIQLLCFFMDSTNRHISWFFISKVMRVMLHCSQSKRNALLHRIR